MSCSIARRTCAPVVLFSLRARAIGLHTRNHLSVLKFDWYLLAILSLIMRVISHARLRFRNTRKILHCLTFWIAPSLVKINLPNHRLSIVPMASTSHWKFSIAPLISD